MTPTYKAMPSEQKQQQQQTVYCEFTGFRAYLCPCFILKPIDKHIQVRFEIDYNLALQWYLISFILNIFEKYVLGKPSKKFDLYQNLWHFQNSMKVFFTLSSFVK